MNQPLINTGEPRNVLGHIVSGAVASALVSGTINYKKLKKEEISSQEAIKDTIKRTSQGAIATGAAIATANYLGQKGGLFKALTALDACSLDLVTYLCSVTIIELCPSILLTSATATSF